MPDRDPSQNKYIEQYMENSSYDETLDVLTRLPLGYDGVGAQRKIADCLAMKITTSGDYTYIAKSSPGTSQSDAKWQVVRIDSSTPGTTVFTWADGNASFDNVATDLTALSYS